MESLDLQIVGWTALAMQLLGLASVVVLRLSPSAAAAAGCQCLFVGSFGMVGLATAVTLVLGTSLWPGCCVTLSLMVVGAILDLRQPCHDGAF